MNQTSSFPVTNSPVLLVFLPTESLRPQRSRFFFHSVFFFFFILNTKASPFAVNDILDRERIRDGVSLAPLLFPSACFA